MTASFVGLEIAMVVKNRWVRLEMKPDPIFGLNAEMKRKLSKVINCSNSSLF